MTSIISVGYWVQKSVDNMQESIFAKRYGYDPVSGNSAMPVYPEG
ncbi:MAG: hypothetical protein ACLTGI_03550 [Hoylesella buccalis]